MIVTMGAGVARWFRLLFATCVTLVFALFNAPAQSAPATGATAGSLIGIWASETTSGPTLQGQLAILRHGSSWRATLGSAESEFKMKGETVRFAFPDHLGQFRGTLCDGGRAITGYWLQPSTVTAEQPDQAVSRQSFATPLILQRASRDRWRGNVRPLENRFTLYLKIYRDDKGSLVGAFRNPEINSNGGASLFHVTQEGNKVLLTARPDEAQPEIRHIAILMDSPDRLRLNWPDVGSDLELVRRTPAQAPKFFPRPPGAKPYAYRKPPDIGDGWTTAHASDVGIDETALTRLVQKVIETDSTTRRPSLIHSILVARNGKLVLEEYFLGYNRNQPHDLRSAGKTFASIMLGASMMKGVKIAPEAKIYDVLAGIGPFANPDPRKSQITLAQLMTHSAGFTCDDYNDSSPGNEVTLQSQRTQPNWWKYTLDLPMAHDPGSLYAYCSANMNLVGGALTIATGTWLPELFDRTVARPLQFGPWYWNLMPTDEGYLGGGSWLRPRDLLKVGQTYLDGGVWRGKRIVEASWVAQSTAPHFHITPVTTGLTAEQFSDQYLEADDGYAWHLGVVHSGEHTYRDYAATGNGGQLLIVIPELNLTVVFTGGNYRQGGIWLRWPDEIIGGEIIPAIRL